MRHPEICQCGPKLNAKWEDLCKLCRKLYLKNTKLLVDMTEGYSEAIQCVYLGEDITDTPYQLRLYMRRDGIISDENQPEITSKGRDFVFTYGV